MDKDKLLASLHEIKAHAETCINALSKGERTKQKANTQRESQIEPEPSSSSILTIVNKIKNCDEADAIETQILDKVGTAGRILLPFFICYKYFPDRALTTGEVAKITGELRVKIKTPNVSKTITNSLQKYLDGDSTRVKGKAVSYKLNRKGAKYFESLLKPHEE